MSVRTCTMEGMVPSQPGICVSVQTPGWGGEPATLSVFRAYDQLPNSWGGKGVHKPCDHHNKVFPSADAAFAFALDRGYLRPFYTSLRAKRKAEARDPRMYRRAA